MQQVRNSVEVDLETSWPGDAYLGKITPLVAGVARCQKVVRKEFLESGVSVITPVDVREFDNEVDLALVMKIARADLQAEKERLALEMIREGKTLSIIHYFFSLGLDLAWFVSTLVVLHQEFYLCASLQKFPQIDQESFLRFLLSMGKSEAICRYVQNFDRLSQDFVLSELLLAGYGDTVRRCIDSFTAIDREELLRILAE